MATRSAIGLEYPDKKIKAVYCHWDGDLGGVGYKLFRYYNDRNQVENLLNMGFIDSLGKEIGKKPDPKNRKLSDYGKYTVFWKRDLGEKEGDAVFFENREDFVRNHADKLDVYVSFLYLFDKDGKWIYYECDDEEKSKKRIRWRNLKKSLEKEGILDLYEDWKK